MNELMYTMFFYRVLITEIVPKPTALIIMIITVTQRLKDFSMVIEHQDQVPKHPHHHFPAHHTIK